MAQQFFCDIEGTEFGPTGQARVVSVTAQAASNTRNGTANVVLTYPYGAGYSFYPTQEIRVYRTNAAGTARYGILGGFLEITKIETIKTATAANAYVTVVLQCVDYNTLFDHITTGGDAASTLSISSGTFKAQITEIVQKMQYNGHGTVSRAVEASSRVTNLTGATTYAAFEIRGKSLRQVMRERCALAQANTPALRPRFSIILDDDGASGVQPTLRVWDGANPPSTSLTLSFQPSGSERGVIGITRTLDGSKLRNRLQAYYTEAGYNGPVTVSDSTSQSTYKNRYINHGTASADGYWTLPPSEDTKSTTIAEATEALTQSVAAVAYPRESIQVTYDKPTSDTVFLYPGDSVTVKWAPFGLSSVLYEVAAVAISFPVINNVTYERLTLTLGLPLMELFEDGVSGAARAPIIGAPVLAAPTFNAPYTTGYVEGGGWAQASIAALSGAVSYNYYYRTSSTGAYIFIENSNSTTITLRHQPRKCTRYLVAAGVNSSGKEGLRSSNKQVDIGLVPVPLPPPSWDEYHPDESDLRGLEVAVGTSTDLVWLTTPLYDGKTTLSLGRSTGTVVHTVLGPMVPAFAGEVIALGAARRRSGLSGSSTSGLFLNSYNSSDTLLSTQTVFSALATTSFVYTEEKITTPASTAYVRWALVHDNSGGSSSTRSYFSQPRLTKVITPKQAYFTTSSTNPVYDYDTGGTARRQHYYSSGADVMVDTPDPSSPDTGVQVRDAIGTMNQQAGLWSYSEDVEVVGDLTVDTVSNLNRTIITNTDTGSEALRVVSVLGQTENALNVLDANGGPSLRVTALGSVAVGDAQIADNNATDGFFYMPAMRDAPTGTPTTIGNSVPCIIDSHATPPVLWCYVGSTWYSLTFT